MANVPAGAKPTHLSVAGRREKKFVSQADWSFAWLAAKKGFAVFLAERPEPAITASRIAELLLTVDHSAR